MVTAMKRTALSAIVSAATLALAFAPAWAQDPNSGDAPSHGVARLSYIQGNVGMRHGDQGDLSPAALNMPLVATDRVETGDGGRAEIQFDYDNMIRVAPSTEVRLSQLEQNQYQVQIAAGTVSFRVLQDNPGQVDISTPTVSVRPTKAGTYRIMVRSDGITEITVRDGEAEIYGPQGSENLQPGQTMQVRGSPDNPEFQLVAAIPLDDFDRFNQDRDKVMQSTSSYRPGYVPPDVTGGESLDQYGQWQYDPNYGNVWVPNEPPGWAPYQNGQWIDESYYGWTWLGVEPWGWAPYHYGSWYWGAWGGWAWWPGPFGGPHFWRPALVGFFGWGGGVGVGVGFGFGHVGWVPLAPFEVYHPWYGAGAVGGRYSVTNVTVNNAYRNIHVNNAISSMNTNEFGRGAISGSRMIRPNNSELTRASAVHGSLSVPPSAASHRVAGAVVNPRGMPQTASNMRFSNRSAVTSPRSSTPNTAWHSMNGYNATGAARGNTGSSTFGSRGGGSRGGNFGGEARGGNASPNYGGQARGGEAPRPNYAQPRQPEPNYRYANPPNRGSSQPLRMNPPIVRERSAPSGGGMRSAPAPRGGGGGGGGHGGGGGGHGGGGRR